MNTPQPASPSHAKWRRQLAGALMLFWLPALVAIAQPTIHSIVNDAQLPLRNIQIEVRQVQSGTQETRNRQSQRSSTAQQHVLVINGRSATIALRSSTPFRLMQTRFRNGTPFLVPGVVLLDATTGFSATPRWDGSNMAELELAASQAGNSLGRGGVVASSNTSSTVLVPLGEWVTVAESDVNSLTNRSDWGGQGVEAAQQASELQVRLSVR